jgi:hypothetical protein
VVLGDALFQVFQVLFQVFHLDVVKVDLGYCICCNDNIRMLQAYVSSISDVSDVCFKCVHLDVVKVDLGCCNDNIRMLQAYVSRVLDVCFKCIHLDIAKVNLGRCYVASAMTIYAPAGTPCTLCIVGACGFVLSNLHADTITCLQSI